ncbi:xanthine dehydrogenase subunit D [Thalassorhabdus alkalitolerans]|uniref:Xanthine dehydrogenase subunit D n=1 Tax=Thalassorhabdus alkalitolerans TaxID=2282697 RepID=A0ABW0YN63_9BACI
METANEPHISRNKVRPDGVSKITGDLKYLSDLTFPNMLYGKILRSEHPHAAILSISTEKAERVPGVKAVATYKDVPGLNGYGIVQPDQPVFCQDRVRYVGDAVAAVAAETEEAAAYAMDLIEIEYEELDVIDDPKKALNRDAPKLHPDGNLLHRAGYSKGTVMDGFGQCTEVVEETYQLPRQLHGYMDTEGGVIVPEADGGITVYIGTQHGFKDRFQLSRILALPEEKIRVVSSPMGGSFGGKDELNIQPYAAILALLTKQPVKIHQTRKESFISSIKRHPMRITMKTGANDEGKILAHKVDIVADTGAYSTLGPAILDFAVEHAVGPYIIPNVEVNGISVFTNNGVAGEFRGFGGNQVTFALEGQVERLAEKLNINPVVFRKANIRREEDLGPLGQRIALTEGAAYVLEEIKKVSDRRVSKPKEIQEPWKKKGTGIAITMHGGGLGYGRLDPAGGRLSLREDGKIEISFGFEEVGQGILSVIDTIITEELGCSSDDIDIVIGDTNTVPASGSTTASRGTSMVWHAVQRLKGTFIKEVLKRAEQVTTIPKHQLSLGKGGVYITKDDSKKLLMTYEDIMQQCNGKPVVVNTSFDFPTTPDEIDSGHFLYTFSGVFAEVEVNLLSGKVKVTHLDQAVSAGPVVSHLGYTGQIEGGGVMALGYTLFEEALMVDSKYVTDNLDSYMMPSISDVPFDMDVKAVEMLTEGYIYGPRGVGEIGTVAVSPAVTAAIKNAVGCWVSKLPVSSEELLQAVSNEKGVLSWIKN